MIEIIKNSNSNEIVKTISKTMKGKTFHHHYHILYDIRTLLGNEKKIYTEIGTYCGGSMALMMQHNFETEINCIDPLHVLPYQKNIVEENIQKFNKNNYKINIHQKFSNDVNFINELNDNQFKTDILFIDGDHSYNGVLNDFYKFQNFVNTDGYIIFDDYLDYKHSPQVKPAVDNIVAQINKNQWEIIGSLSNYHKAYDGDYNLSNLNEFIIKKIF
jgi:cephalosporin hydroxylase